MKREINSIGKWVYTGASIDTPFDYFMFQEVIDMPYGDTQQALHTNIGSLTVLDRMTGYEFTGYEFGCRDIETGYRDKDGKFWLASGNCDVRESGCKTLGEAIEWVKQRANTCEPDQ